MTNILYIIDNLGHGGTERQLAELIQRLDRDLFCPHICTLKPSSALYEELDIPKISLNFVSFCHPSIVGNFLRLSGYVHKNRIQIIQAFFQDPLLLAAMLKLFHQVKLIGSFRDLGFWRTSSAKRKMRLAYPFFSGFIANSQAVKDHYVKIDGLQPEKVEVIYNGFDCSILDEAQAVKPHVVVGKTVGIVANLNRPVKRVDDFIRAVAVVREKFPDARYMIVGDGHLKTELEELAYSLGLKDFIKFTGRVDNPFDYIRLFTVGVITSETEGFCNAIIEYMAWGVPVVVTNAGGNNEIVCDGQNGFLTPVGDYRELARKVIRLLEDSNYAALMGDAGLKTISNKFTIDNMMNSHYNFYNLILQRDVK
jgi:L-malate glycosyltransferase